VIFVLLVCSSWAHASEVVSPADVLLLLDSSDSSRSTYFEFEERFAVQLVRYMYSRENRFGLFTFGENTHYQFYLDTYNDEQQIVEAIEYMWFSTGNGAVEKAINFTLAKAFQESKGDRECVPNILLILTHSAIKSQATATELRDALNRKSVQTFVLNMAGHTATENLAVLTNASSRVISIEDFEALENSVTELVEQITSDLPSTGCGKLTQWQPWSHCSATCGPGERFRLRECQKEKETDKMCAADLSEDATCTSQICTDPVDGRWANWNSWSACSKSCESGIQTRIRECISPAPMHGGKPCPNTNTQQRNCSEWKCPDCEKTCPAGGQLSHDCQICECSSATLFGQITDDSGLPVEKADIYLESRRYKAIASSGEMGLFSINGICLMNEKIYITAKLHESKLQIPSQVNFTHWTIDGTIEKYIPAVFAVNPRDKSRMLGQSFTLCCSAVGKPSPLEYKWFKDDIELDNIGINGTLTIRSASQSDAGSYKCATETLAGVTLSEEAQISISDVSEDTCGAPVSKFEQLPAGCYLTGDTEKNEFIDVRKCGRAKCMTSLLKDNGTCADWWPHYCCDSKDVEELNISCDGFSYKTTIVKSCTCRLCILSTTVSGRAIGRNNSRDIPFQLGDVYANGKYTGKTNMAGFFKFEAPTGVKRVIATFHDNIYNIFMDTTKIISVTDGEDVYATIVIPLKPKPIPFNTSQETEIGLGDGSDNLPPAAKILIEEDSFLTSDGKAFKGTAKATVQYMDPRYRDSLDAVIGDFVSETPGGEQTPLRTYGVVQLAVDDEDGNPLQINKPLKFTLDASLFNITGDSNGETDIAVWDYDVNKGVWVENTKFRFVQPATGRRKLLQSNPVLEAIVKPEKVEQIDPNTYKDVSVQVRREVWNANFDKIVVTYENVTQRESSLNEAVCYIKVSVYTDMTLTEPVSTGEKSVKISAYAQENNIFLGKGETRQLKDGNACVMTFCNKIVFLNVDTDGGEMLTPARHSVQPFYPIRNTSNTEIMFEARYFGAAYDCPKESCIGPVFLSKNRVECEQASNEDSFHFSFAFFTKPSQMSYATGSENIYDQKLSWYPVSPDKKTFRSCFFKILLKIYDTYDIRIVATSFLRNFDGEQFGTHIVGPTPDPKTNDISVRGACLEFRCPGYVKDGSTEIFDVPTAVQMQFRTKNSSLSCKWRVPNVGLQADVTPIMNGNNRLTGLRFLSQAGVNYGSSYGVFINDANKNDVESFCKSGLDRGPSIDGLMNPLKNPAVELDCLT